VTLPVPGVNAGFLFCASTSDYNLLTAFHGHSKFSRRRHSLFLLVCLAIERENRTNIPACVLCWHLWWRAPSVALRDAADVLILHGGFLRRCRLLLCIPAYFHPLGDVICLLVPGGGRGQQAGEWRGAVERSGGGKHPARNSLGVARATGIGYSRDLLAGGRGELRRTASSGFFCAATVSHRQFAGEAAVWGM
jgi:hypothetical protein